MTGPRRPRVPGLRLAAVAMAAAATVALTQSTAVGAFTAVTGNGTNRVGTATTFCTAAPTTLLSAGDSWTDEALPDDNHISDLDLHIRSSSTGDRRTWIRFDLPGVPARCQLASATLYLYNKAPTSSRNVDVYRGDPTDPQWTAASITWNTEPDALSPVVTNASTPTAAGWQQWPVTPIVTAQYAYGNNGFVLRDRNEGESTARHQLYYDRQNATYFPYLVLTWD